AAVALGLAGVVAYQAVPDQKPAAKHTMAYWRVEKMLHSLQAGDYKTGCDVLAWWFANRFVDRAGWAGIASTQMFPRAWHMKYRMLGEVVGRQGKYVVVTAEIVQDDPGTKIHEPAICEAKWAAGKSCVYAGVYTFGVQLTESPEDTIKDLES